MSLTPHEQKILAHEPISSLGRIDLEDRVRILERCLREEIATGGRSAPLVYDPNSGTHIRYPDGEGDED